MNVYMNQGDQELANRTLQNIEGLLQSMADRYVNQLIVLAEDFNHKY